MLRNKIMKLMEENDRDLYDLGGVEKDLLNHLKK